jgi:hypothetical protein
VSVHPAFPLCLRLSNASMLAPEFHMCVPPPSAELHGNLTARFVMQMASRRRNDNRNDSRTRCDMTLGEMQPRLDRGAPPNISTAESAGQRLSLSAHEAPACTCPSFPVAPLYTSSNRRSLSNASSQQLLASPVWSRCRCPPPRWRGQSSPSERRLDPLPSFHL